MKLTRSEIEAISIHMNACKEKLCNQGRWHEAQEYQDIVDKLDELLTESVIRCKDCKHWRANTQFCAMFSGLCTAHRMPPDGYCSEAERKEE